MRNHFFKYFLVSVLFILSSFVSAAYVVRSPIKNHRELPRDCDHPVPDVIGDVEAYFAKLSSGCGVYVTPSSKPDMIYRSYFFSDTGLFQIFNSYSSSEKSTETGVRAYFFLPRKKAVNYRFLINGDLLIETAVGSKILISHLNAHLVDATGFKFIEDPQISKNNFGGVEITESQFLFIDSGFKLGDSPYADANRTSKLYDFQGRSCSINNRDLFNYYKNGENLKSDMELTRLFAAQCPDLNITALQIP
jgi:hypothetical protein